MRVQWIESHRVEDDEKNVVNGVEVETYEERIVTGKVIGKYRTFFGTSKFLVEREDGSICNVKMKDCKVVASNNGLAVRVKKLNDNAVIPMYAHSTDAGMDLVATSKYEDEYGNIVYGIGLAFEIPEGYAGFIFPRSSNYKHSLLLSNCVGIVDAGYRGEVSCKFRKDHQYIHGSGLAHNLSGEYEVGERVAQMVIMPFPKVRMVKVNELSNSERGTNGYGSTGK